MKTAWKRAILGFVSLVLLCVLALAPAAGAATKLDVGVAFWKEKAEQTSLADDGVTTTAPLPSPASPTAPIRWSCR